MVLLVGEYVGRRTFSQLPISPNVASITTSQKQDFYPKSFETPISTLSSTYSLPASAFTSIADTLREGTLGRSGAGVVGMRMLRRGS